jgi:hypothetical protein
MMGGVTSSEPRTCCVRNCPRLGDDAIELSQGMLDSGHEVVAIYWFCREHQRLWYVEPVLSLEHSRIVVEVRLTDKGT